LRAGTDPGDARGAAQARRAVDHRRHPRREYGDAFRARARRVEGAGAGGRAAWLAEPADDPDRRGRDQSIHAPGLSGRAQSGCLASLARCQDWRDRSRHRADDRPGPGEARLGAMSQDEERLLNPADGVKPLDFGADGIIGSIDRNRRVVALNTYHPQHGFVTLTAADPFDEARRYDQAAVRDYRA